jgi:Tol biopolymer transport system component
MGATGESVRRVTDYGYDPAWSPDGRELIVATEPVRDPMARAGNSQLWAVRTSGEGKRLVSKGDGVGPKWSPDGRWVAFWGLRPSTWHRDLWMIAADGSGTPVALTDDASIDWGVEWSPDGRFLYFSSNRGGTMSLLRIPIDPRSGGALGAPEPVTTPAAWAGSLSFAKDGRRFAFGTRDWRADAWKVALDPEREVLQGRPLPILRGQPLQELDWSPDGTSVVFARRGLPWESLGVVRADGSGYSQLTDASFQHRALRWSPDGQRIAFQSQRGGVQQVWVMRTDGSALQHVSGAEPTTTPVWSPDGRRIAGSVSGAVTLLDASQASTSEPIERFAIGEFQAAPSSGPGHPTVAGSSAGPTRFRVASFSTRSRRGAFASWTNPKKRPAGSRTAGGSSLVSAGRSSSSIPSRADARSSWRREPCPSKAAGRPSASPATAAPSPTSKRDAKATSGSPTSAAPAEANTDERGHKHPAAMTTTEPFRARVRPARPSPDSASRDGAKRVPRNARSRDPWSPIRTPTPRRGRRSMRP